MTSSPAMSAAARGRETPDAGAFLGKEGGINPSLAVHSSCPGKPQRAWPQAEQRRGTGGQNRRFPWLQPGTEAAQGPTTLQDPSMVRPPHQHREPGVPTAGTRLGLSVYLGLWAQQQPGAAITAHAPLHTRPKAKPRRALLASPRDPAPPEGSGADTEPPRATLPRPPRPVPAHRGPLP